MGELQLGLVAIGAGVVAAVFLYNKWQERQYRRKAEEGFAAGREDFLLREHGLGDQAATDPLQRLEPVLGAVGSALPEAVDALALEPALYERVDFIVPIEASEEISGAVALQAAAAAFEHNTRFVRWEGFDPSTQSWEALRADHSYALLRAGLQLVDRRGAASVDEIAEFGAAVEQGAAALGALAAAPEAARAAARAAELDRFCSEVDIRVAVHIVSDGAAFAEDQVRAFAVGAGFELDPADGKFRRRDGAGRVVCTLGGMAPAPPGAAGASASAAGGVTIEFDVPGSADEDFDRFRNLAEEFARRLGGRIVDDNQQLLGPAAFDAIRDKVRNVHRNMELRGIHPAGALALRLFS